MILMSFRRVYLYGNLLRFSVLVFLKFHRDNSGNGSFFTLLGNRQTLSIRKLFLLALGNLLLF